MRLDGASPAIANCRSQFQAIGLGLWDHLGLALALECGLVVIGLWLYLSVAKSIGRKARCAIIGFMGVLTTVAIASQATITEIPDPNALAISMIVQTLIVTAIVFWIDRNRVNSVK
ncbi:MAG: hypothetical protein HOJ89_11975 [Opitutales bacterium]|nr:hypothetical protein [Opitutales bacterium]